MTLAPLDASATTAMPAPRSFTYKSPDSLTLAGKEWRPAEATSNPERSVILCLSGLSRNTRDFNDIAKFLQERGYRVVALDYRGRGDSDWDPDWRNYSLPVEEKDIDAAISHLGLKRFAVLGTSRGGLHALTMALRYPSERMTAVIFNDIGPHIEVPAIRRIAASLGQTMTFPSLEALAAALHRLLGPQFPAFADTDWLKLAGQLATEEDGGTRLDYDADLVRQFALLDDGQPLPDLWPLYDAVKDRPVLVIRGSHSDLLSEDTAQRMVRDHPNAALHTVCGQGHAPVLWDRQTQELIGTFLDKL